MPVDIGLCSRVVELLTRVTGSGFSGTAHPYFPTTTHLCSFGEGNSEINMNTIGLVDIIENYTV